MGNEDRSEFHRGWHGCCQMMLAALEHRPEFAALRVPKLEPKEDFHDVQSHRNAWRAALVECLCQVADDGDDADRTYWQHEIEVFDRTFDRLKEKLS